MSPFAIVLQAAICGAVIVGALAFLAAHWIHDALHPSMSATLGLDGDRIPDGAVDELRVERRAA
jgi:hypothetical protein